MLNVFFFIFPFFLYLGIAVQGLSYYLIGIVIPSFIFLLTKRKIPPFFIKIGLSFILLHIIFPLVNFIIYFFPNKFIDSSLYKIKLQWPGILQSNFPSSLFFGGIGLILFTLLSHKILNSNTAFHEFEVNKFPQAELSDKQLVSPIKYFLLGLAPASFFFLILILYQYHTGIDLRSLFRKKIEFLSNGDTFQTGGFRVYGFYGHPLTVAGICLTYSIFSWTLLWSFVANKNKYSWGCIPCSKKNLLPIFLLATITFSNEVGLFLSGGRTAALVGLIFLLLIPLCLNLKSNFISTVIVVATVAISSFFISKKLGILNRIEVVTTSLQKDVSFDKGNYRQYFWRTYEKMFMDKPFVGQGNYWLKQGVREVYYEKMGYGNLPEKYSAHNIYLEILGSVGLIGMIWIISSLTFLFQTLKKNIFYRESNLRILLLPFIFAFMSNLIHGITQNVFFDSSVVYIYICLIITVIWEKAFYISSKKASF